MSKPRRNDGPGRLFHVTGRVNWRAWHLGEINAKLLLAQLLKTAAERFGVKFLGFAFMDNHFHLVVQSPEDPLFTRLTSRRTACRHVVPYPKGHQNASVLSQFMRTVRWAMSRSRQASLGLSGRFWDGPFDARPILSPLSLAVRIAYDHRNPVKAGIVDRPQDYRWSSARTWTLGTKGDIPLALSEPPFGATPAELRKAIMKYQRTPRLDAIEGLDALLRSGKPIDDALREALDAADLPILLRGSDSAA